MSYEPRPDTIAFRALAHMDLLHKGSEIPSGTLAHALGIETNTLIACLEPAIKARAIFRRQKGGHIRSPIFWSLVDHSNAKAAPAGPVRNGSQKPDDAAAIPGARAGSEYTPERGSQHVLKAEPARCTRPADATDRETPANASPRVGAMGVSQPADAGAACDHGSIDGRCAQCAADIRAGAVDGEILVGGAAPAVDAHEHFARTTIDQVPVFLSKPTAKPEVKPITSNERLLSVLEYVTAIDHVVPPDPPPAPLPRVRAGTTPYRFGIFNDGEFVQEKGGLRIVIDRNELEQLVRFIDRMRGEEAA